MVQYFPEVTGSLTINGSLSVSGPMSITGSIAGTSSLASNALLLSGTGSVGFATTGSFTATSSSLSSRTTQIESVYATTGSNSFRATQSITGSLTVTGQIIAQTLNVQQVTSSIVFSSGSNTFGCDLNSRQTFTGSVLMTGSLIVNTTGPELQVNNNGVILGNLLTDNHSITGSLRVTGSATFTSTVTAGGNFSATADGGAGGLRLTLNNTGAGEVQYVVLSGGSAGTGFFGIRNGSTGTNLFLMNGSGATTFASSICATSALFNGNAEINVNQNSLTRLLVRNTTAGTGAYVETSFQVDSSGGAGAVGKYSSSTNAYKIIPASSTYLYNSGAGDISILNDFSSGAIRLAAGGSSSAHLAIASTGAASFSTRLGVGITSDQNYASVFVGGDITTGANQYAILADPQLSGTSNNYAVFANARIKANTAVTNAFGVYIPSAEKISAATITNNYALYIANQTSGATLNYSIYSAGGLNYFAGNVCAMSGVRFGSGATTLNYFEEGCFQPRLLDLNSGTVANDNYTNAGRYTKIGNRVFFAFYSRFNLSGLGSGDSGFTPNLRILLPFTAASTTPGGIGENFVPVNISYWSSFYCLNSGDIPSGYVRNGENVMQLTLQNTGCLGEFVFGTSRLTRSSSAGIMVAGHYFAA